MKKVVLLAVVLVSILSLTSCTEDKELNKLEEKIEERNTQIYSDVDRGDIDRPGSQGGN